MRETVSRAEASSWAVDTWERVKDKLSNEEGWAILMDAADELAEGEYHNRLAKAYQWLLEKGWKQPILEEQVEAIFQRNADLEAEQKTLLDELKELKAEAKSHGPRTEECVCPPCHVQVPGCWVSGLCEACFREECELAHEEEAGDGGDSGSS